MRPQTERNHCALVILIGYATVVAYSSLTPADGVALAVWDKLLHFGCYAIFAGLAWWASHHQVMFYRRLLLVVAFGAVMELAQSLIPGRDMSAGDMVANTLGVAVVWGGYRFRPTSWRLRP